MFTGIIESLAEITKIEENGTNLTFTLTCDFVNELQIDQSVAHDGVCLTVVSISENKYTLDAVAETLEKTNLSSWQVGRKVNVERCLKFNGRLDGHIVQGHVDTVLKCIGKVDKNGSWEFTLAYPKKWFSYLIPKGSITLNGTSLTIADLTDNTLSVAIIPYTYEHTNLHQMNIEDMFNVEFDMIGKYINRINENNNM